MLSEPTDADPAPLPAADPRLVRETGTVRLSSPFYVARSVDRQMESALGRSESATLIVKGPRQSGKSSLLARAHALMRQSGKKAAYLDLQALDAKHLESLGGLLLNLAARIARDFGTAVVPRDVWDEDLGDKTSFAEYLRTAVLAEAEEPVLLCFDEVDRVFDCPYRDDFFSMLRGWHNKRALAPEWDRLHLAIAHATDPALWIEDVNQSPFNVGEKLSLDDFTITEISELASRHGVGLDAMAMVEGVRRLTGGQPYLVRQALYVLARKRWPIDELRRVAAEERGPFGDHLRQRLWVLQRNERMREAFKQVLSRGACADEIDFQRLHAAGLVAGESHRAAGPRCELYGAYFRRRL